MHAWLDAMPAGDAMWVELEPTEAAKTGGPLAELRAHVAGATFVLATCDAHPTALAVDDEAVDALRRYLAPRS